ncbi:xylulokinase [Dolosicoccus paucivorans]|uniref:Xylulose kinase n=1 Tax=Dolosicoccus paucivorans TaxID=84521 RepID=A0A2N6SPG6_9LACT|nr:xylulokinase [Dolosicoccus paucivorans]PMC58962.1 xylulokinase [Dolosicoccus paucivorans]
MSYVLGIDIGTSSLKGIILNQKGEVKATESSQYDVNYPYPNFSEQDPKQWIRALKEVLKKLNAHHEGILAKIAGISFSGQMHSLVLLDELGEVIRPAILWNDTRTFKECKEIKEKMGSKILQITKNIPLEGFTLPKVLWVKKNEPGNWKRVWKMLLPKDYVRYWLTGAIHMDFSDASGTLMFNPETKEWSQEILNKFDISPDIMPTPVSSQQEVGKIKSNIAREFSISPNVSVFAGGADNACAALASGVIEKQDAMVSIGTSGVFLSYEEKITNNYDGKLHYFCHVIPERYYSMGVTLSAGNSLKWFKETFATEKTYSELLANIHEVPPGSHGLVFTPFITGERTPYFDPDIKGAFIGISAQHTLDDFGRSVVEGITFSLRESQELLQKETGRVYEKIVSVGGGAKNPDWLQIQSDVFQSNVYSLETEEGPGYGAAMIAAVGIGWFATFEECSKEFVQQQKMTTPHAENIDKYNTVFNIYKQIYRKTAGISRLLKNI